MKTGVTRAFWIAALGAALLWPMPVLARFAGIPLDRGAEAILIGLAVPMLLLIRPKFLDGRFARAVIVGILAVKLSAAALLTPQGLCAKFSTAAPYATNVLTIPIDEPSGALRSWDVRADWRAASPTCTAIVDRPYFSASAFPAWFVNITDFATGGKRDIAMDVTGYVRAGERGLFVVETGADMTVSGRIGTVDVASVEGRPMLAALDAGTHRVELHAKLTGDRWQLVPTWNGRNAFTAMSLTTAEPRGVDRLAALAGVVVSALTSLLLIVWAALAVLVQYRQSPMLVVWCAAATLILAVAGATGRCERVAVVLLAGAVLVPVADQQRQMRAALLLVGVPWLGLIAARSLPHVGLFSAYSIDDWLAYQVAGYRIYMNGFWLEGGSRLFDYQPLYRWISGALHLVFGDSSVGEIFWDAICLLLGAMVAFVLVERSAGFKWGVAAAVATLATFWLGTIWYFVGRGLSEIAAAGWGFIAALVLLRARTSVPAAIVAGVFAVLMFYTRLNHLLFGVFLVALLPRPDLRAGAAFLATFAAGVAAFAARTWWYTGTFSLLYGTSLKNNDTGLRLTTIADPAVWSKVWHSLKALVWMNEPPSPDPRAVFVVIGVLVAVAVVLRVPKISRLPASIAIVTLGACVSSLLAHTHNYPGRMSIHLAPYAVAMTMTAGARLFGR